MSELRCNHCGAPRDSDDNYCRRCGRLITINLPAVRQGRLPTETRSLPPSLLGSVAVLALGTGLEWLARRVARGAVSSVGRALVSAPKPRPPAKPEPPAKAQPSAEAVTIDEVLYIRQVRLRQ